MPDPDVFKKVEGSREEEGKEKGAGPNRIASHLTGESVKHSLVQLHPQLSSSHHLPVFKVPHGAPAGSPHTKRSALSVDGIINNSAAATAAAAAAASASNAYAAGLQAAAAAAIGLGQLADLSAVYRQATAADQVGDYHRFTEDQEGVWLGQWYQRGGLMRPQGALTAQSELMFSSLV
ncbi:unnamed protein product [Hydatigera taeniaeformis]|uniref:Protein grainyhead n=1 Tax=Hydatigena taeniaeformis TaxID=6205 RepID=A0A0R3X4E2_HYDTA|nr:unnamed protein product [Hydatigera taeniaeformis]